MPAAEHQKDDYGQHPEASEDSRLRETAQQARNDHDRPPGMPARKRRVERPHMDTNPCELRVQRWSRDHRLANNLNHVHGNEDEPEPKRQSLTSS
jgi:hypothetical protein